MKLTLCMIVKNEEKNIGNCLEKIKDKVDEIVIVDTGSGDKTKEIAMIFTEKVYDFKWNNDFSEARNYAAMHSCNSWILVLDADEFCLEFNKENIENALRSCEAVGRIEIISTSSGKTSLDKVSRIYNKDFFEYKGNIHEQITPKGDVDAKYINVNLKVEHIGYDERYTNLDLKIRRNVELLMQAINERNNDPYLYYQLGKAYFMGKYYIESSMNFEKAIGLTAGFSYDYVEDMIETYGYALLNLGKFEKALSNIKKYENIYKDSPDFIFLMGLIHMNNFNIELAISYFNRCVLKTGGRTMGITSYLPLYNIGVIYECIGEVDKAINYYEKCSNYELALERLRLLKKH